MPDLGADKLSVFVRELETERAELFLQYRFQSQCQMRRRARSDRAHSLSSMLWGTHLQRLDEPPEEDVQAGKAEDREALPHEHKRRAHKVPRARLPPAYLVRREVSSALLHFQVKVGAFPLIMPKNNFCAVWRLGGVG